MLVTFGLSVSLGTVIPMSIGDRCRDISRQGVVQTVKSMLILLEDILSVIICLLTNILADIEMFLATI